MGGGEALVAFDRGPDGGPAVFRRPRARIIAETPEAVPGALAAAERAQADGHWLAGYASYELGLALEPRLVPLMPAVRAVPLLCLGVFDAPEAGALPAAGTAALSLPVPVWTEAGHGAAVRRVLDWIAAGDCYQVNLTFPMRFRWEGEPAALYARLAVVQPVDHGAFVDLGGPVVLSRSPELFFETDGRGGISVRPMKGTAPREADLVRDQAVRAGLAASTKDRAENLMIVDLMRNDLSRVSAVGSVAVPELFAIESYATVHQMVSRVDAHLLPGVGLAALFGALFPCGSVTGAPKIRAMEIIRTLEAAPRGVYCGSVGWVAPDGRMRFNVAIRTLTLFAGGEGVVNVGGGIVADSTPAAEYEEALWKARFTRLE